jgi:hypothetical protein
MSQQGITSRGLPSGAINAETVVMPAARTLLTGPKNFLGNNGIFDAATALTIGSGKTLPEALAELEQARARAPFLLRLSTSAALVDDVTNVAPFYNELEALANALGGGQAIILGASATLSTDSVGCSVSFDHNGANLLSAAMVPGDGDALSPNPVGYYGAGAGSLPQYVTTISPTMVELNITNHLIGETSDVSINCILLIIP